MTPFFFVWMHSSPVIAQPAKLDGYAEWRGLHFSAGTDTLQFVERIRPSLKLSFQDFISVHSTLDLSLWHGRDENNELIDLIAEPIENTVPPNFDGNTWTFTQINEECDWGLSKDHSFTNIQYFFDRLHLDLRWKDFDVRIGRQALSWGSALFINPSDPVPQTLIETPWQERAGIDALYITHPVKYKGDTLGNIKVVATNEQISGQAYFFLSRWEGSVTGLVEEERSRWALNLNGDNIVGWWGEMVWHQEESPYLQANVGLDYTFPVFDGIWAFVQIYHDGSGKIPALYEWNKRSLTPTIVDCPSLGIDVPESGFPKRDTLGRWYTVSGQKTTFFDDWSLESILFMNLEDQTGIHSQFLSWQGGFLEARVGFQQRFGQQGEFAPPPLQTTFMGEDLADTVPSWRIISWLRYSYAL